MTDRGDNAPPRDGWQPSPRACPFPECDVCDGEMNRSSIHGFGVYPPAENIIRGEN